MSKELYEDALADVRQVKKLAEDNAKHAVLEALTPRIHHFIEKHLINELGEKDDDLLLDDEPPASPTPAQGDSVDQAAAISPPDEEGKVTLDLDALAPEEGEMEAPMDEPLMLSTEEQPGEEDAYELSAESVNVLSKLLNATSIGTKKQFELSMYQLDETIHLLKGTSRLVRESSGYKNQISQMISRVENMYEYVRESVSDTDEQNGYAKKLESCYKDLRKLREQTMMKNLHELMSEDDDDLDLDVDTGDDASGDDEQKSSGDDDGALTLKLTGLPDDVDVDDVGVDLVSDAGADVDHDQDDDSDEDDQGGDQDGDQGSGDDLDLGDLDVGGDDDDDKSKAESVRRLSDDTIVEVDERMLRREIRRLKSLRELADNEVSDSNGYGVDAEVMDDFGGGAGDDEPFLDGEVETDGFEPLGEGDDIPMDEDEDDLTSELQLRRKEDECGLDAADSHSVRAEALRRRLHFEKRLQERARRRIRRLKTEAYRQGPSARLKRNFKHMRRRFNESVRRSTSLRSALLRETSRIGSRSNSGSRRLAEVAANRTNRKLRRELAEKNLINTKLVLASKLLQNESLSKVQKAHIIKKLDEARTIREAKLVYGSLAKAMTPKRSRLRENRVLGSASRALRPASTQNLNEGYEMERWNRLAGLK